MAPRAELPAAARCVIVGGGVGGTSLAYHLARLGWEDVVLLERSQLTSGSTFHSAGLVGQLRGSVSLTKMMMHSVDLYRRLKDESEFDPGWVECGGIRLASSEARMEELRRQAGWAKTFGLPLELISAEEAQELFPLMSTEGVLGAAWLPTDGYLDPSQLTYALADGARRGGCRIFTSTRVTGIDVRDGRVRGVRTDGGEIEAEVVVDAGGMFAAEIGRMAGVRVPLLPFSHQYLVTQPLDAVAEARRGAGGERRNLPTLRDPDLLIYYREDGDGLVMGGYERNSEPAFLPGGTGEVESIPADFNGRLLEEDWDRMEEIVENSKRRVPAMDEITVTKLINGPEAFTPDNEFCLGETEVGGFFVCAGFCAHGLAGAGGIGRVMAEWIAEGEPSLDLWEMDIRRFGAQYRSPAYTHARIEETYETYYDIRYPNHERSAGRPLRVSPVNAWHREHGAAFGEKSGWERVNWYESNAAAGDESLRPRGWSGKHWSAAIGAEHRATRERVAVFDESSFSKLEIEGPGAAAFLEGLCDNRVAREAGRITYTQMLNRRGGIECDFTVARLGEELFSIVTGTAFGNHDREWMRRHLPADGGVRIHDVTSRWACIGIWGPRARDVLAPLTPADLGNEEFPYMSLRETTIGDVPGARPAGHLRRRAGLGALLPERVRHRPLADDLGGGRAARHRRRRLPGDRLDAAREGLPGLGRRHHPRRDPRRGRRRLLRQARQGGRLHRPRCARRGQGARPAQPPLLPGARGPALDRARQRAGSGRRGDPREGHHRRLRLHGGALDRLRLPAARERRPGDRGRGRDLRPLGAGRGGRGAAAGPEGRADPRLSGSLSPRRREARPEGRAGGR